MKLLPDMHRISDRKADWERIPEEQWNEHQRRAAETNGWDTPGNRETIKGVAASFLGLAAIARDQPEIGLASLFWGRMKDLKDGRVADATGTKSPKGEGLDAISDNVIGIAATGIFWKKGIISDGQAVWMAGTVGLKFVGSGLAKARGVEEHASRIGKIGTAIAGSGFGLKEMAVILADAALPRTAAVVDNLGNKALSAGLTMNTAAGLGYLATGLMPHRDK